MKPRIVTPVAWARWGWMVESVAERHDVGIQDILSATKERVEVSRARHDLMSCLWGSGLAFAEIGRLLGRDHTTVMYGVRRALD